jgi:hypothetical protein
VNIIIVFVWNGYLELAADWKWACCTYYVSVELFILAFQQKSLCTNAYRTFY